MAGTIRFLTFLAPNMIPVYEAVARFVGRFVGASTELVTGERFDQIGTGPADVAFICGLPYVQLMRLQPAPVELLAAPVPSGARYRGKPVYFSDVIVRRDTPWRSFRDLKGASWAYNDPDSHSGYNVTRHRLVQMGETHGFFGRCRAGRLASARDPHGVRGGRRRARPSIPRCWRSSCATIPSWRGS